MRKELFTMVLLMGVCVACQNEELESNVGLDNIKSEAFDLEYIMTNADSVSCGTYTIVDKIETLDSINNGGEYEPQGGIVSGEEWWVEDQCYIIDGPYAFTQSVTHPAITSPITTGLCGITATVYYNISKVYRRINGTENLASYYTCVKNIERVETRFYNGTNFYLLWQDGGSRAYCPSSSYDPVLYPQEWIYVIFQGRIVGEKGFFNPYVDANEQIYWETSFRIPLEI